MTRGEIVRWVNKTFTSWRGPVGFAMFGVLLWLVVAMIVYRIVAFRPDDPARVLLVLSTEDALNSALGYFVWVALGVSVFALVLQVRNWAWREAVWTIVGAAFVPFVAKAAVYWATRSSLEANYDENRRKFADNLVVPTNIEVAEPEKGSVAYPQWYDTETPSDDYGAAVVKAMNDPHCSCSNVTCRIDSLDRLMGTHRGMLLRYLASHPGWHVCQKVTRQWQEKAKTSHQAIRRLRGGSEWLSPKYEYYEGALKEQSGREWPESRTGFFVLFDGEMAVDEWCRSGETIRAEVTLDEMTPGRNCTIGCKGENLTVIVNEGSSHYSLPRMIQTAYDYTEREFSRLALATSWDEAKQLLPQDGIRRGESLLKLFEGAFGYYTYCAWVNPGQEGETYLKLFEVTTGRRLSADRIQDDTCEMVGWSDDSAEKFCVSGTFPIMEGELGKKPFAVRIEVWFTPANGGPERKLVERVFKVKGGGR